MRAPVPSHGRLVPPLLPTLVPPLLLLRLLLGAMAPTGASRSAQSGAMSLREATRPAEGPDSAPQAVLPTRGVFKRKTSAHTLSVHRTMQSLAGGEWLQAPRSAPPF